MDRISDTFRWKGENVSTTEVSETICAFPGIKEATVYGVEIPGTDGRAGMAALVTDGNLDLTAFQTHLVARLPAYAQPLFLRVRHQLDVTATFKHAKRDLERGGYNPTTTTDAIYFNDAERKAFVRLDRRSTIACRPARSACDRQILTTGHGALLAARSHASSHQMRRNAFVNFVAGGERRFARNKWVASKVLVRYRRLRVREKAIRAVNVTTQTKS